MLELRVQKDKNGVPIVSAEMLDRFACGILVEFQSNILQKGEPVNIQQLAKNYFGVHVIKQSLTPDYSILAMTTLEPIVVTVFDSSQGWVDMNVQPDTILIDDSLFEPGQEARLNFVIAHELSHLACHKDIRFSIMKSKNMSKDVKAIDLTDKEEKAISWIEWQADYMASALLMPRAIFCKAFHRYAGSTKPYEQKSEREIAELATYLSETFRVSKQAAFIRMYKLDLVSVE